MISSLIEQALHEVIMGDTINATVSINSGSTTAAIDETSVTITGQLPSLMGLINICNIINAEVAINDAVCTELVFINAISLRTAQGVVIRFG